MMLDIDTREGMEDLFRTTGGQRVTIGAEETWGHFNLEPEVALDDLVLSDVPTLTVPRMVPGFEQDAALTIEGHGAFQIRRRMPASSPGETLLILRGT